MDGKYNERRDSVHIPADAGEYTDGLVAIMMRIPDGWGRWISCDKGWYPIIVDVDRRLCELDPIYSLHQVKEKFGGLRYYFKPTANADHETLRKMQEIVRDAEARAGQTCECCGSTEQVALRDHGWWKTMCDKCDHAKSSGKS